jgi:hypothetical protein
VGNNPHRNGIEMKSRHKIVIRSPQSLDEYEAGCELVELVYRHRGYCDFLRSNERPPLMIIAMDGEIVRGSVGIIPATDCAELPTEYYFGVNISTLREYRDTSFEICKLAARGTHGVTVLKGLVTAICQYSIQKGWNLGLACMKSRLAEILDQHLGIPVHNIENHPLIEDKVEPIYSGYFLGEPRPQPYYVLPRETPGYLPVLERSIEDTVEIRLNEIVPMKDIVHDESLVLIAP